MKARSVPSIALLSVALLAVGCILISPYIADAQKSRPRIKTFTGSYDSEFPYPIQEGVIGQRDSSALAEIKQSVAANLLPEHAELEVTGTLTSGLDSNQQQYPASFSINNGRRFRLDIKKENGIRTLRINGDDGKVKQNDEVPQELEDTEFVSPLGLPMLLPEIAARKDAAVIDDGTVVVKEHSMNKVTITLFRTRFGNPVSASFYFDSNTHMLEKGVFVEHSEGNRSLAYLAVMTYEDYREDQSMLLPHKYCKTINGQLVSNFKVTNLSITSSHDDSYFSF